MFQRSPLLAPAGALLLLGGCAGTVNRSLESVHQPVVARADYNLDLGTGDGGLAPGEARRLVGWLDSLRVGYGDQVAIDDPARDPGARDAVAKQVARFGLLLADDQPVTGAPVAPGTVRVVVSRLSAGVPGCPDYTRSSSPEYESNTSSNFGCATYSNIAAMAANPTDLVRGDASETTTDTATAAKAINAWRGGQLGGRGGATDGGSATGGAAGAASAGAAGSTGGK